MPTANSEQRKAKSEKPISIILLAAGLSRRMGRQNKLLLPLEGRPLIYRIADAMKGARAADRIVVCGHESELIEKTLQSYPFRFVYNSHFASGMTSSIQAGVKAAGPDSIGFMICLADLPELTAADLNFLSDKFASEKKTTEHPILVPVFGKRRGHPVIFDVAYREEILSHQAPEGCSGILRTHATSVRFIEMPDQRIFRDIDSPDDYQQIINDKYKYDTPD